MQPALIIALIVLATLLGVMPGHVETRVAPLSVAEERALKPKDSFKECDNCPEMVVVPKGKLHYGLAAEREEPR